MFRTLLYFLITLVLIRSSCGSRFFINLDDPEVVEKLRDKCEFEGHFYPRGDSPMIGKCSQVTCKGNCKCVKQRFVIQKM